MIFGFTGLPGSGKTLAMLRTMHQLRRTHDLFANFHTANDLSRFTLWADFLELCRSRSRRPRALFVDEAQIWFPSRSWKDTSYSDLARFQQHRKNGVDLYWSAQNEARVDIGIRELTAEYWKVSRLWRFVRIGRCSPPDQQGRTVKLGSAYFFASDDLYRSYWTQEIVGDRHGEGYDWGTSSLYSEPVDCLRVESSGAVEYILGDAFEHLERLKRLYSMSELQVDPGFWLDGHWFPAVVPASESSQDRARQASAARAAAAAPAPSVIVNVSASNRRKR